MKLKFMIMEFYLVSTKVTHYGSTVRPSQDYVDVVIG